MIYYISKNARNQISYWYEVENTRISFIEDEDNTDYQEYLKWLALGNVPESAE